MSSDPSIRRSPSGWEVLSRIFLLTWPLAISFQVWIVTKIHSHDLAIQSVKEWQGNSPQFTAIDAENLRTRVMSDSRLELLVQMGIIATKLESIQASVIRLEERRRLQAENP